MDPELRLALAQASIDPRVRQQNWGSIGAHFGLIPQPPAAENRRHSPAYAGLDELNARALASNQRTAIAHALRNA